MPNNSFLQISINVICIYIMDYPVGPWLVARPTPRAQFFSLLYQPFWNTNTCTATLTGQQRFLYNSFNFAVSKDFTCIYFRARLLCVTHCRTLYGRWNDVKTLKRRRNNVVLTSCASWVCYFSCLPWHFKPCLNKPYKSVPQWSQNVGLP